MQLNDDEYELTMYVPTKGRPENALRLQDAFDKTTTAISRIVFINSDNDQELDRYHGLENTVLVSPAVPGFVNPLNLGFKQDSNNVYSYAVGFMGDDHLPRTRGWDERFLEALKIPGFVYGNDKFQESKIPTQVAMTSDIPRTLGFMTLPQLSHLYADNWWLAVGEALGRITYLDDVVIEHMHPAAGKASNDKGYEFSSSFSLDLQDRSIYYSYLNSGLDTDVKKIKSMLKRTGKL